MYLAYCQDFKEPFVAMDETLGQLPEHELTAFGESFSWRMDLVWLHAASDGLLAIACIALFAGMLYLSHATIATKLKNAFRLLSMCMLAIGMTYLFSVLSVWQAAHYVSGFIKVISGLVAGATAVAVGLVSMHARTGNNADSVDKDRRKGLYHLLDDEHKAHLHKEEVDKHIEKHAQSHAEAMEQLERELFMIEEAHGELTSFFMLSLDAFCISSMEGHIALVNPAFTSTLGYKGEDLQGMSFLQFVHPDDKDYTDKVLEKLDQGESILNFDCRYRCKDRSYKWLNWTAQPDPESNLIYITARDVTKSRETKEALRAANAELDVARRTVEEAYEAKSDVAAAMSMEILTPLQGVLDFSDLLMQTDLDHAQYSYADSILANSAASLVMIQDVFDVLGSGKNEVSLKEHDFLVHRCVENAIDVIAQKATGKGLEVAHYIHPEVPREIEGDSVQIKQILVALLSYAVKMTGSGGIYIDVYFEQQDEETAEERVVCFAIRDTGAGISAARLDDIAEPYSEGDIPVESQLDGLGLGFAIAKKLTKLMQGVIEVESEEGIGSTFFLKIPVRPGKATHNGDLERIAVLSERSLVTGPLGAYTRLVESWAEQWGMTMHHARTEEELYDCLENNAATPEEDTYSLVILDDRMPDCEIADVVQKVQAFEPCRPILLLAAPRDHEAAKNGDTLTIVPRPLKEESFYRALVRSINLAEVHAPEEEGEDEAATVSSESVLELPNTESVEEKLVALAEAVSETVDQLEVEIAEPPQELVPATQATSFEERHPLRLLVIGDEQVESNALLEHLKLLRYTVSTTCSNKEALDVLASKPFDVVFINIAEEKTADELAEAISSLPPAWKPSPKIVQLEPTIPLPPGKMETSISILSRPIDPLKLADILDDITPIPEYAKNAMRRITHLEDKTTEETTS